MRDLPWQRCGGLAPPRVFGDLTRGSLVQLRQWKLCGTGQRREPQAALPVTKAADMNPGLTLNFVLCVKSDGTGSRHRGGGGLQSVGPLNVSHGFLQTATISKVTCNKPPVP